MFVDAINCPNCGAHELEGKFCAYCGTQLLKEEPEIEIDPFMEEDSFELPVGEYKGTNCSVILEESAFLISRSGGKKCVRIPYNELHGLYYYRPKDKFGAWGIWLFAGQAMRPYRFPTENIVIMRPQKRMRALSPSLRWQRLFISRFSGF